MVLFWRAPPLPNFDRLRRPGYDLQTMKQEAEVSQPYANAQPGMKSANCELRVASKHLHSPPATHNSQAQSQPERTFWHFIHCHLPPATLLALFVLLLFYPLLFTNRVLASGDILPTFIPIETTPPQPSALDKFRFGIPTFSRCALRAQSADCCSLPAALATERWLPVTKQIYWAAIHAWILGMGGYALMRRWQMSSVAGLTTALVLAGSGFYGGLLGHANQTPPPGCHMGDGGDRRVAITTYPVYQPSVQISNWQLGIARRLDGTSRGADVAGRGHTQSAYINLFGISLRGR